MMLPLTADVGQQIFQMQSQIRWIDEEIKKLVIKCADAEQDYNQQIATACQLVPELSQYLH